jgi:hypothetical protein
LYFPNLLVIGDDSISPCGATGLISFENVNSDIRVCGELPLQYKLYSNTSNIIVNSIDETGINVTSVNDEALANPIGVVGFIVSCGDVALYVEATIVFTNPCINVICGQGEVCDKCTGNCVQAPVDIAVEAGTAPTLDIKVT